MTRFLSGQHRLRAVIQCIALSAAVVLFGVLLVFSIAYVRLIGREGEL